MNKNFYSFLKTILLSFFVFAGNMSFGQTVLYSESVSGDLPNTGSGPVLNVSATGTYVVNGTMATTADGQDRFQIGVGSGLQISDLSYSISGGGFINGAIQFGGFASASGGGGSVSLAPYGAVGAGNWFTIMSVDFSTGSSWSATFTVTAAPTAPSVSTQPANKTACAGTTATFTSTATGSPTPTVQWQESPDGGTTWNDISGATNTTLSVTATSAKNGYQYGANFTNSGGTDYSNAATLTVTSAVSITTNPSNQSVTAGSSVSFTAAATSATSVQWQVSTDGGATYSNISGATSNTLTFTTASADNGKKYRAVYTNGCGSVNTTGASLTVMGAPVITTNPANASVCSGNTATFSVSASGTPSPTVQWQISTDGGATFNNISGATTTSLSFSTSTSLNNNEYRAVFTNTGGNATTTAAILTVNTAPGITTNPGTQTVCAPNSASFTAAATGTPAPTVQWQVSTNGGSTFSNVAGATSAILSFATTSGQNSNQYRAVFTNTCGSATSTAATLNVNVAPTITSNPSDASFCPGTSSSFTSAASGTPSPSIQWQISTDGGATYSNVSGATNTTYAFTNLGSENGYKYRAVFTNTCGSATSTAATIGINTLPAVTTNPNAQTVCSGNTATFTAAASGIPATTVQWQVSTDGGASFTNVIGATSTTLGILANASMDNYQYRAVFTNACNTATTNAVALHVNLAPSVITNPLDGSYCPGTSISMNVAASGTPSPTVQWQVSIDGGATYNNISATTASTYAFTNLGTENGYKYRAVYTNSCGTATTSAATVNIYTVPAVITNPGNQTICTGNTVSFTSTASGAPAPGIQWQQSTDAGLTFTNIVGATSGTLSFITSVSQNGNQYRAVYANSCNTATSTAATLNITTPPVVATNPGSAISCAGNNVSFSATATATPAPTVQWQQSTDGGISFSNIAGATATTLSFTSSASQNNYQYRAVFTNTCGTATTTAATITVNVATAVTTNPSDLTICENATAGFVAAASGTPTPSVQWQMSTDGGASYNNISGATSNTLLFATLAAQTGNKYRAVYTNSCGTATTAAALLNVNTAPVILTNPVATIICAGSNANFSATASGIPAPAVQWQQSTDGGLTFNNIAGANSTSLTFATLLVQNNYQYRAMFTNTCGTAYSTAAVMTVNSLPTVTSNPTNTTICAGTSTFFTTSASGTGINYQWQMNSGSGFGNVPALSYYTGINSPILSIFNTLPNLNGYQYRCVISGTCTPVAVSSAATLTVNSLPAITNPPASVTICAGNNTSFSIAATGTALAYQWQVDPGTGFSNVTDGTLYSGSNAATLNITAATLSMHMYNYRCIVSGACTPSLISAQALLRVNSLPAITANPANSTVCTGQSTSFTAAATGTGISYQWQVNSGAGFINLPSHAYYSGGTSPVLSIANTLVSLNGYQYRCVVTGTCTPVAITTVATLTVNTLPAMTSASSNVTICVGNDASFSVSGTGTGVSYQWQVDNGSGTLVNVTNGGVYSGANTATLTITKPPVSMNMYNYSCVISGVCSPAIQAPLSVLRVYSLPTFSSQPVDETVCENSSANFDVVATGTGIAFQWQMNDGTGFVNVPGTSNYTGINTRYLTILSTSLSMNGYQYRCLVNGTCTPSIVSTTVTLSVNAQPKVTADPVSTTICEGNATTFSAAATGTSIHYVWQLNRGVGFTDITNSTQYSGATTPSLTINYTDATMNGYQYRLSVVGICHPVAYSAAATLNINTAPAITVQPGNTQVCNTASTVISLVATGTGLTYQWQINTGSGFSDLSNVAPYSGTTTAALAIATASMNMNGYSYRCVISGTCPPTVTSNVSVLSVTNMTEWTGAVNNKWSNPANWSCGIIPVATTNVYIPGNSGNAPVVDIPTAICDSIAMDGGASLSFVSGHNILEIKGTFTSLGSFDASAGRVVFSGTEEQLVPAGTYGELYVMGGSNKMTNGDVSILDTMDIRDGIFVLANNNLTIDVNAVLRGGNDLAYILTNGKGKVKEQNVGAGTLKSNTLTIPIGADNSYTPITFINTGVADNFEIGVATGVYNNYDAIFHPYGAPISNDAVNKTWWLNEETPGGSNVTISVQWNTADQLSGFNPQACYLSTYNTTNWTAAVAIGAAVAQGAGAGYVTQLTNVTRFPLFGVGSPFVGSVYTPRDGSVTVFPNPASGSTAQAKFDVAPTNNVNVSIIDLYGAVRYRAHFNPYDYVGGIIPLDISGLVPGEYILNVEDAGANNEIRTTRFIKL